MGVYVCGAPVVYLEGLVVRVKLVRFGPVSRFFGGLVV